ncbi:hypothetical protein PA905_41500 [Planktothrix agardhii CCAP 1459/11A]|uniref:DUF1802 domain-containing protein n=1 Tax=Planktothrix agardhii CCAP 1459/11A TaxID=282420 RepID=A0A4P5ZHP6_PLAAG|nr:DUF1802 family protein [Planktothrix agardhii]GDZ95720.1 hypothetical protein PA905_41500 [Planktothrix agardhii CCAP 1459/11A]
MFFKQALSLPAPEVSALTQGRMIVILPSLFLGTGQSFFLYPAETSGGAISLEEIYRSSFLPDAKIALNQAQNNRVLIKSWAKCELCHRLYDHPELLEKLAQLTIWTGEGLRAKIEEKNLKNLAYLRVYKLPEPFEIEAIAESSAKIGKFLGLSISANVSESIPILDDIIFAKRQASIKNLESPEHPELEELENAIAQLTLTHPDAKFLKDKIQTFLGWQPAKPDQIPENLKWIYTINQLGTATEGGNYEKGTAFENIVHQSLSFLGFELDQNAKGGAGGMDLYCTKPYLMVGECKAGKSLPDSTAEQLYRIGVRHLGMETYQKAVKLIIGPGKPTSYLEESAQKSTISIINPMTLEKLVKLQAQYPGSVNLIELKKYLQAGQMDDKIDEYIETVIKDLKLRSHIIKVVKDYLNNAQMTEATVSGIHGLYCSNPPQPLPQKQLHEILVELSSPLSGYLGRNRADDWRNDSFYYLRELIVDQSQGFDYNS